MQSFIQNMGANNGFGDMLWDKRNSLHSGFMFNSKQQVAGTAFSPPCLVLKQIVNLRLQVLKQSFNSDAC
jgi:hypothetical protein